jgi:DNA-binding FrmR family transcriptional regulator
MRNKQLLQNRLRTLQGQLKKLDMQVHRGGNKESINEAQRAIEETVQDIVDIVEREA